MAEKNTVPNLEAKASDGNQIFTPRQWLERFRQFTKREDKIDITPLIKREDILEAGWTAEKETNIQEDFFWGVGPEALYQITRAEYKTEPDSIKIKDLFRLYTEHYLPKRNTYHNRGDFFWAKQSENETPEEFWRRLIEIEKECNFGSISAEELLISKYMTAITDKKLRDKLMKEKTLEMKKTIKMIKQNTYEKKNKKNTIPEALITAKKTSIQRGTDTKNGKTRYQAENKNNRKPTMQILQHTELEPNTQMPRTRLKLQQLREERTLRTSMQTKNKEQPNSEKTYRRRRNRTE